MKQYASTIQKLRQELSQLHPHGKNAVKTTLIALRMVKKVLAKIEVEISSKGFPSLEDEIIYFKEIKPPICSLQIAYAIILQIEQKRPLATEQEFKKIIRQEIKFLKKHFSDFSEFSTYYENNLDYHDKKYFLRENKCIVTSNPLLSAQKFTTGYDVIAAYLLAYKFVVDHYNLHPTNQEQLIKKENFNWSKDKVAFVELISGLHAMNAIKGSNVDLKTLTNELGSIFGVEIKDVYGKRKEIKARKGERFKFLRQMLDQLEQEFDQGLI